ncbi:MAG TPA: hypothetical protein VHS78_00995 [Candidatus Elarobacter sp.]|jgi:hypothetical protein|nr:hypothetical protein [Candidatus Elarobacter sp.]
MTKRRLACLSLAAALATTALPAAPALADGAASTRNILIGGAAAALLIINHNKKVHEKYAEYDRRQASTQAEANNAEAAYESERQAYAHEAALVSSYQHEVAVQHQEVLRLRHQVAMEQSARSRQNVAQAQPVQPAFRPLVAGARVNNGAANTTANAAPTRIASTSTTYGWGTF